MIHLKYLSVFIIIVLLNSCSKEEKEISFIKESDQNLEMITAYKEGYEALNNNDPYFAANKFLEAELLFPQSKWASRSSLMASYSYYMQNFHAEALSNLERFLKTYPNDPDIAYAHYLMAVCFYETIEDEKRDTGPLIKAKNKFIFIIDKYPKTDFALDAEFKLGLIEDLLASKEMYLGRHYMKKSKWIAAINRFKYVIEEYDETIFVEEALHRLVEINYKIGLLNESQKYANVLGYNYLSSKWYKKSYKVFNKNYKLKKIKTTKKEKKGVISKFKKLFD
jgi:outer membrane protein assembly factor BamD